MWLPIIASVGVGAATFYSMTKHDQNIGQAMQQMIPFVSQMSGNTSGVANGHPDDQTSENAQKLGPYGMS